MEKVFLIIKAAAVVLIIGSRAHSQSVADVARRSESVRMAFLPTPDHHHGRL